MDEEPMNQWRAVLSSTKNTSIFVACYLYHSPGSGLPQSPHYPQLQSWKTDSQVQAERLCRRRHVVDLPGLIATPGVLPRAQFCQCKQQKQRTQESSYMDCQIGHFTLMSGWCLSPPEPKMSIEWSCCTGAQVILLFLNKTWSLGWGCPIIKGAGLSVERTFRRQTLDVRQ